MPFGFSAQSYYKKLKEPRHEKLDEVYLVVIGECQENLKPVVFRKDGTKILEGSQFKSLEGIQAVHTQDDGTESAPQNMLLVDRNLPTEKLFLLKEVIQEPTEIDAMCHLSNMLGDGNGDET